jgi:hypothetical protein
MTRNDDLNAAATTGTDTKNGTAVKRWVGRQRPVWPLIVCAALFYIDLASMVGLLRSDMRPPRLSARDAGVGAAVPTTDEVKPSDEAKEFLSKEYENAVKEIQGRIEQENSLFGLKFTLVGAILALLFTSYLKGGAEKADVPDSKSSTRRDLFTSPVAACFCWAAVITSAIIDSRIHYHQAVTTALGTWIETHVEPVQLGHGMVGWESYIVSESVMFNSRAYALLRVNANLLTLVLFGATAFIFSGGVKGFETIPDEYATQRVCRAGSWVSFVVFFVVGLYFHYSSFWWRIWCGFWMLMGLVLSAWVWHPRAPKAQRAPSK